MGTDLGWDIRRALRALRQSPVFTVGAILVLALGIGVNAAIFTAVKALLLEAPPYPEPDRVVLVDLAVKTEAFPRGRATPWSYPMFSVFREAVGDRLGVMAGFASRRYILTMGDQSVRAHVELVSPEYLTLLGAVAALGRLLRADEGQPGSPLSALLSHRYWTSRFGGDPSVLGRIIDVESQRVEIVGVAARDFDGLTGAVDLWLPLSAQAAMRSSILTEAYSHWFNGLARLPEGVTLEQARAWAEPAVKRVTDVYPDDESDKVMVAAVRTLREGRSNPAARTAVLVLAAGALLVLLIACANLAGLLLVRAVLRRREMAVRAALGARPGRLLRALLTESLALALLGGLAGLLMAALGVRLLAAVWPARFAVSAASSLRVVDVAALGLDPVVLAFSAALTVLTGLLFGILPALQLAGAGPHEALRSGDRVLTGSLRRIDGRSALISVEVALALVLLVGAGLMTSSMIRLLRVDRGYDPRGLLTFAYSIPRNSAFAETPGSFHDELLRRLSRDPRVRGVALGCAVPLSSHCVTTGVSGVQGRPRFAENERPIIGAHSVSPDYFATLGVPLLAGRTFNASDDASAPLVAVINAAAARRLFGADDPVGRTIAIGYTVRDDDPPYTVIGVAGDVLYDRPEQGVMPEVYVPLSQDPSRIVTAFVRATGDPLALLPDITQHLRALDPGVALYDAATAQQVEARATADTRVVLWLLATFAASAVLLAAIGIWSIVAYAVSQRTRELGLRLALGARAGQVITLVLRRGAVAAGIGVLIGIPSAYAASRLLTSLLFAVRPTDPAVYVACALGLAGIALIAAGIPALRAARVDPMQSLRVE